LYSQDIRDVWEKNNCATDATPQVCGDAFEAMGESVQNVNPYDIYRFCWDNSSTKTGSKTPWASWNKFRADPDGIPCVDIVGATKQWNDQATRTAFNVGDSKVHWDTCVFDTKVLNYTMSPGESIQLYPDLIKSGLRIQIYSGDTDSTIAVTGTMAWIESLVAPNNLKKTEEWHQWSLDDQVAGFTQVYNNTFRFLTIKGTGHMSIQWKRPQGFMAFNNFLQNKTLS
jgi:carboxypeptidase C (cathepsin A)